MFVLCCVLMSSRTRGCCVSLKADEQESWTEAAVRIAEWNKKGTRTLPGYFMGR